MQRRPETELNRQHQHVSRPSRPSSWINGAVPPRLSHSRPACQASLPAGCKQPYRARRARRWAPYCSALAPRSPNPFGSASAQQNAEVAALGSLASPQSPKPAMQQPAMSAHDWIVRCNQEATDKQLKGAAIQEFLNSCLRQQNPA
jgi:hypothetical protein